MIASNPALRRFCIVSTVCLTLTFLHRSARAEAPADQSAALVQFELGRDAYKAQKFAQSLVAFESSLSLSSSPNTRLYIGRCQLALGRAGSAYTSFRLSAREAQERLTVSGEQRYSATRDAAAAEAAALEDRVPRLIVSAPIDVPPGMIVLINGKAIPVAALGIPLEMDAGGYEIEAKADRRSEFQTNLTLKEGSREHVEIVLPRIATAFFSFRFASRPQGITVALDNHNLDSSDAERQLPVDVGEHSLVASAPGYLPFRWHGSLADRAHFDAVIRFTPKAGDSALETPRWLFYGVAGVSVLSLGVASAVAVHARSRASTEHARDPLLRDSDATPSIDREAHVANALFITGGVFALGAAALALTTRWHSPVETSLAIGGTSKASAVTLQAKGMF